MARAAAGPSTRAGLIPDPIFGARYLHRVLSRGAPGLQRPRHRAGAVGQADEHDRQQRIVRDHPHVQQRLRRRRCGEPGTSIRKTCGPRSTRSTRASTPPSTTASIAPASPPRRRPMRRRSVPLFETLDGSRRRLAAALSVRRPADRGGLAPVHDADSLRPGLFRPFQMQPAANRRLSGTAALSARALPLAGRAPRRSISPYQAPLLCEPLADQSDRDRAARSGTRAVRRGRLK